MTDPLVIDGSGLSDVAKCERKAVARMWHGLTSPHEAATLRAGSAVHEALDHYFRSDGSKPLALHAFDEAYREFGSDPVRVPQDDRLSYANVKRILAQWLDDHTVDTLPFVVRAPEKFFAERLADDIVYVGRMDGDVTSRVDGRPYVLETKTTGRVSKDWKRKFRTDAKTTGYVWAANRAAARSNASEYVGVILNAIELNKLPGASARVVKCREHGVPYAECGSMHNASEIVILTRTPEELAEWHAHARQLAYLYWDTVDKYPRLEQLHEITPRGKFSNECQWCFMREVCEQQAEPAVVQQLLVVDHWEPVAGVRPGTWQPASGVLDAATAV